MNPDGKRWALERSPDWVSSALCLAQRLSLGICLGLVGKWILKAGERGMTSCLLLEAGSQGWAMLLRPTKGRDRVTGKCRREGVPEPVVLGPFLPSIWDLQSWYSGHQRYSSSCLDSG